MGTKILSISLAITTLTAATFGIASLAFALEESPINRIENPHYVCELGPGEETLVFRLPAWDAGARVWLTMRGNDIGLETEVQQFSYLEDLGQYEVKGQYVFSGGQNLFRFTTEVLTVNKLNGDGPPGSEDSPPGSEDLPPGSDDAPPGSEDLPPGAEDDLPPGSGEPDEDNGSTDPAPPEKEFAGPDLKIRYEETSADGARIIYQSEGQCVLPRAEEAKVPPTSAFVWRSWGAHDKQKPAGN